MNRAAGNECDVWENGWKYSSNDTRSGGGRYLTERQGMNAMCGRMGGNTAVTIRGLGEGDT